MRDREHNLSVARISMYCPHIYEICRHVLIWPEIFTMQKEGMNFILQ